MAVTGVANTIDYFTDGTSYQFQYPYYLFQPSDLDVSFTPSGGSSTPLVLNSDYNLSGTADTFGAYPNGIALTTIAGGQFGSPLPANGTLLLTRSTEETQQIQYVDGDKFPAMKHEHALDKLTLEIQDIGMGFRGFLAGPPTGPVKFNDWFIVYPAIAGTFWGYIYTTNGWKPFAPISF
jgi:hypothetical protein